MIGRPARGQQADCRIHDRLFVDHAAQRTKIIARLADGGQPMRGGAAELLPQFRSRLDERRSGDMETHHLHHHLVGIGSAVESACAGRMVAAHFAGKQFLARRLALGIKLAHALLFLVRDTRPHRARGHENCRQVAKAQRAHQQAGDDLVADAEQRDPIVHRMAERDRGRQGNRVAAEQRQFHAGFALRHAVAHGRRAAGDLRRGADFARPDLHAFGIAVIGLMRRQHVVVGGDNTQVRALGCHDGRLVFLGPGKGVGEVGAGQRRPVDLPFAFAVHQVEVGGAAVARICDDALGHAVDRVVERLIRHASLLRRVRQGRWRRWAPSCPHHRLSA